ncbi:MAG: tRNA (guanosine(18)-2'-O)-methyltransferase [Leptospiraceae bacterium]|nr:MAG: tRNA (guanosine(18)-2'-O)-methyltransferase [Leptospiraceae bacterium]
MFSYRNINVEKIKKEVHYLLDFLTEHRKERFLNVVKNRTKYITVVLEDIYDPHNGSACLRSCDANGIQDIYIIERKNIFSTKEGVSMGSGKWLTLYRYNQKIYNSDPTIYCFDELKQKNYKIYGMSAYPIKGKNNHSLLEVDINQPLALVFGSEKDGLSSVAIDYLDDFIQIPMFGFVESYNISVACAITIFTLMQRLRKSKIKWQLSEKEKYITLFEWLKKDIPAYELILKNME